MLVFIESTSNYKTDFIQMTIITLGEGLHNYCHMFPYDYSTSEKEGLAGLEMIEN